MANKLTGEAQQKVNEILVWKKFLLEERENYYAQTKRFYVNRASGGDCHYRHIDGDIDAGTAAGEKAGTDDYMQIQPQAIWPGGEDVLRR